MADKRTEEKERRERGGKKKELLKRGSAVHAPQGERGGGGVPNAEREDASLGIRRKEEGAGKAR